MQYELIAPRNPHYSLTQQVFLNRGFEIDSIDHYLHTSDKDIYPTNLLMNLRQGAVMLIEHINNNDDILIIIDSDADGYTSSALLINYLHRLFPVFVENKIKYYIHSGKQHGLDLKNIPYNNYQLLICPDSSSNDYQQHKTLFDLGIDILVLDHHEADMVSNYACIINNQLCDYPNKSLSGVGVVYKFCQFIDELMDENLSEDFLDLVALGEISDVMNLQNFETRRLISKGLSNIRNPFFYNMVQKNSYSMKNKVSPTGVAFYVTPYINAVVRVGNQEDKYLLFKSMLDYEAYKEVPSTKRGCKGQVESIVEQACRNCSNIKNHQAKDRDLSLSVAENEIEKHNLLNNKILAIIIPKEEGCKPSLTGLIANVLMDKYQRPVLLLNHTQRNGEAWLEGSGRGYNRSKLEDFRGFLIEQGIENYGYAQGHAQAFGFGILEKNSKMFFDKCNEALKDFVFEPCYKVDFVFEDVVNDCDSQELLDLLLLENYWGQGVEEPYFAFSKIKITNGDIVLMSPNKNPTLKIKLPNGIDCIKFKSSQEEVDELSTLYGTTVISLVGRGQCNEWNGNISPQIIIEDYQIDKKINYDF